MAVWQQSMWKIMKYQLLVGKPRTDYFYGDNCELLEEPEDMLLRPNPADDILIIESDRLESGNATI
ncbi:MAG: hypothetical protein ACI920_000851 [Saprospiraceae bacterium]|jgi:hypothetical protein